MITFDQLKQKQEKVCVVGLGYVGLPLAILLAKHYDVIGFDIDTQKVEELKAGHDRMREVSADALTQSSLAYSADPTCISTAKLIIVAVPTPVDDNNIPDMRILEKASAMVGEHLAAGSVVVFESTVYPGATEEVCLPLLEQHSGLVCGKDFSLGYSPERVNPGDKEHTIDRVVKVVSGKDANSAELLAEVYGALTTVHVAPSIKVAEAAKIIENTQRDINIALMNELSCVFHKMNIDTYDVLAAAGTKWNFLRFEPGLVGGHCIGVDPYYLTYKAQKLGHKPQIILAGREINDGMPAFIVEEIFRNGQEHNKHIAKERVVQWGITFKENVPDVRNSKAAAVYDQLVKRGLTPLVIDPVANPDEVQHEYGIVLADAKAAEPAEPADVLIVAVKHAAFASLSVDDLLAHVAPGGLIVDIKHLYPREIIEAQGYRYWSL